MKKSNAQRALLVGLGLLWCSAAWALEVPFLRVNGTVMLGDTFNFQDPGFYREVTAEVIDPAQDDTTLTERTVLCLVAPCPTPGPLDSLNLSNRFGTMVAGASASYGALHTYAHGKTVRPSPYFSAVAQAQSMDNIIINSAGHTAGEIGHIGAVIIVTGPVDDTLLKRSLAGEAMWQLSMGIAGGDSGRVTSVSAPNLTSPNGESISVQGGVEQPICDPGACYLFTLEFRFGEEFSLYTSLTSGCSKNPFYGDQAGCVSDLYHSAYWGGIDQVTDADGVPLSEYSITSSSGVDWRRSFVPQAVPEPQGAMLILLAIAPLMGSLVGRSLDARCKA